MEIVNQTNGIWNGPNLQKKHKFDKILCNALIDFFTNEKADGVVDLGCGYGEYTEKISEHIECLGYDGNPYTQEITGNLGKVLDLSTVQTSIEKRDWVLSLEVGNHIPEQFEDNFITNVHNSNKKGIVISWAVDIQKGMGQFNKRPNRYIIQKFVNLGYRLDMQSTALLRNNSSLWWFKESLMVFRKK